MTPQTPHARRAAFTLMELLVVITIIGILAALILAAVGYVTQTTIEVANRNDVMGLSAALNTFKQKYGFFPPSRIKLCTVLAQYNMANQIDKDSVKYITTMFPKIGWAPNLNTNPPTAAKLIAWNDPPPPLPPPFVPNPLPPTGVILEGDQCLVFFLGGIVQPAQVGQPPVCLGFSSNPLNPSDFTKAGGGRVDSIGPFYNFETSRLTPRLTLDQMRTFQANMGAPPNGTAPWGCNASGAVPTPSGGQQAAQHHFYSYLDNYLQKPYLYFSSGGRKNGYNLADAIWAGNWGGTMNAAGASLGDQYLIGPVASSTIGGIPNVFPSPDTFQILSAGKDTVYGQGAAGASLWSPASAPSYEANRPPQIDAVTNPNPPGGNGQDDMANFYGSQLKVAQ